jgi:hypothetical protein
MEANARRCRRQEPDTGNPLVGLSKQGNTAVAPGNIGLKKVEHRVVEKLSDHGLKFNAPVLPYPKIHYLDKVGA